VLEGHGRWQYSYDRPSDQEFERRHKAIRDFQEELDLECLLIGGGTGTWDRNWTNTRWAVNHVGCQLTNYSYVVFPRRGEPTVLAHPISAWMPARRAREVVDDVRGSVTPESDVIARLKELGCTSGKVGIVECDLYTSIPLRHYRAFTAEFPDVQFEFVTKEWWHRLRLIRSDEEISFLERAARIGDAMSESIESIEPGMSEREIFARLSEAMIRNGGEIPTMVLAASGSSFTSFDTFQRERPMNRILSRGDVIVTEVAPRYQDGSECQTGRTYALGQPSAEYERLAEIMLEAYRRVVDQLRPGRTDADILEAGSLIKEAGYTWMSPLIHGAEGGATGSLPIIAPGVDHLEVEPTVLQTNMVVCVEIHVGKPDNSAEVFMADTWVVTDSDPRCLNKYRQDFVIL
jgi:Xaa-Pro aminopeptidase